MDVSLWSRKALDQWFGKHCVKEMSTPWVDDHAKLTVRFTHGFKLYCCCLIALVQLIGMERSVSLACCISGICYCRVGGWPLSQDQVKKYTSRDVRRFRRSMMHHLLVLLWWMFLILPFSEMRDGVVWPVSGWLSWPIGESWICEAARPL